MQNTLQGYQDILREIRADEAWNWVNKGDGVLLEDFIRKPHIRTKVTKLVWASDCKANLMIQ